MWLSLCSVWLLLALIGVSISLIGFHVRLGIVCQPLASEAMEVALRMGLALEQERIQTSTLAGLEAKK